ncbi:FABP family protein [Planosporangium thailandense]|uniref:Peroxynitrite isomerase n=1 Tax=Planosporangium thailandense TaxID=765197 RepID=A0ABX0XTH0_9ACTN|nr:FABP family protein [Planosporangium thailandense]
MSEESQVNPVWMGQIPVDPYPFEETHDLRTGPDLHPALLGLLPFVGVWRGRGQGGYPSLEQDFEFAQEVRFSHDGRPFLFYESRTWLIEPDGKAIRPSAREVGWWRPVQTDPGAEHAAEAVPTKSDEIEVLLTHPTGFLELYLGKVEAGGTRVEMATDAIVRTATAKEVRSGKRLYGIVEGALLYAYDMAAVGQPMAPHISARLERVAG